MLYKYLSSDIPLKPFISVTSGLPPCILFHYFPSGLGFLLWSCFGFSISTISVSIRKYLGKYHAKVINVVSY